MPYIQNALSFVVNSVLDFYLMICILRFMLQSFRVDFNNPISQMAVVLTNPPLQFLSRFIPTFSGLNTTGIALILLLGVFKTIFLLLLSGYSVNFAGAFVLGIAEIIDTTVLIFFIIILASVIVSWVAPNSSHAAIRIVFALSVPLLRPFRKLIPGIIPGIDISPIFALLALNLIQKLIVHPLNDLGQKIILGV